MVNRPLIRPCHAMPLAIHPWCNIESEAQWRHLFVTLLGVPESPTPEQVGPVKVGCGHGVVTLVVGVIEVMSPIFWGKGFNLDESVQKTIRKNNGWNLKMEIFGRCVFSSFWQRQSLRLPRGPPPRGSRHGHVGCDGLDLATVVFLLAAGGRTPGR